MKKTKKTTSKKMTKSESKLARSNERQENSEQRLVGLEEKIARQIVRTLSRNKELEYAEAGESTRGGVEITKAEVEEYVDEVRTEIFELVNEELDEASRLIV